VSWFAPWRWIGYWACPELVERHSLCFDHNSVAECAVFGILDEKAGEVPAAYVCLKDNATVTEQELVAHCASLLAQFKRPRLVKFVDDFPKTPIGKIQKNILREPNRKDREKKT